MVRTQNGDPLPPPLYRDIVKNGPYIGMTGCLRERTSSKTHGRFQAAGGRAKTTDGHCRSSDDVTLVFFM